MVSGAGHDPVTVRLTRHRAPLVGPLSRLGDKVLFRNPYTVLFRNPYTGRTVTTGTEPWAG
jgi:hypothetical protein